MVTITLSTSNTVYSRSASSRRLPTLASLILACCTWLVCASSLHAQGLAAGPMVGHVDMREAKLWVQTRTAADVAIEYHEKGSSGPWFRTLTSRTTPADACVATLIADSVEPGRTYEYRVLVNGEPLTFPYPTEFKTQPIWKWRGDNLPSQTIAIGSCLYVNQPGYERHDKDGNERGYGSEYETITSLANAKPDVMIWMGDNVYMREADWNSRSGMLKRFSHTRAMTELQPLLASTANYAIWDDHDFGPDNSNRGWWGKETSLEVHKLFWPNPSYGTQRAPGVYTSFDVLDVQFILLDDRYYRKPERRVDGIGSIIGHEQINWLADVLASSKATFKIIATGSQFITSDTTKESYIHEPRERQLIIDMITRNNIKGVMFISGDIHAAELSRLDRPDTYPLYDFTSSALTAGSNKNIANQKNQYRVPNTAYGGHNFGLITVSGKRGERTLTLQCMDKDGKEVWKHVFTEAELR